MAQTELAGKRRESLLRYCRVDADAEDVSLIEEGYLAAVAYMEGAGVPEPETDILRKSLYDRCVNALVLDYYDQRGTQMAGAQLVDNPAFRRAINQLKLTAPSVSESDTESEEAELP